MMISHLNYISQSIVIWTLQMIELTVCWLLFLWTDGSLCGFFMRCSYRGQTGRIRLLKACFTVWWVVPLFLILVGFSWDLFRDSTTFNASVATVVCSSVRSQLYAFNLDASTVFHHGNRTTLISLPNSFDTVSFKKRGYLIGIIVLFEKWLPFSALWLVGFNILNG